MGSGTWKRWKGSRTAPVIRTDRRPHGRTSPYLCGTRERITNLNHGFSQAEQTMCFRKQVLENLFQKPGARIATSDVQQLGRGAQARDPIKNIGILGDDHRPGSPRRLEDHLVRSIPVSQITGAERVHTKSLGEPGGELWWKLRVRPVWAGRQVRHSDVDG